MIIWLTGLPCSGKTTIAEQLVKISNGELLDGDNLRGSDFSKGIGFSPEERERHLLRVGFLARMLSKYTTVVCSFVSPSEEVRKKIGADYMVYVKCPLDVCEARDVKGMYAKARAGEIKDFTGIDAPYEPPENPDIVVETDKQSLGECIDKIWKYINSVKK
jgi:adenylylsulfate kinase